MEPDDHLDVLAAHARSLAAAATGAMAVPVPTCPEWTVADLVVHVGMVWGWAAEIVTTGERAQRGEPPTLRSDAELREWAEGEAERLVAALRAADPDAPCWTFGPPPAARFWFRRQALETVLHAWDLQAAVGTPRSFEPAVAADGIDEHLSVHVPRSLRAHPDSWSGETVHLHCTDAEGEWLVRLGPGASASTERAHAKADVALRGTAGSLWLWCTNRAPADALGIECLGDATVAEHWQHEMAF
jgi:uncharacterized protein (TIGR03083 family)